MKLNYTMWLIIINLAVFFTQALFSGIDLIPESHGGLITDLFGLNVSTLITRGYFWQVFTYMFLHSGFMHLFFNMFGLMIFGPKIEHTMGKKRFLKFYLICGVGSSLFYMLLTGVSNVPMIGASGAIFGVLTAYGLMYPRDMVYVYFFYPMPAIVFVIFYGLIQIVGGISSMLVPSEAGGGIAYFGHLGGMIVSVILLKFFGYGKRRIRYFWE